MLPVQQSLLLIDTCEGEAFPGSRGTDSVRLTAMAQLQQATGRNIIATSREAAYEGYKGYGVLTYAILEALDKRTSAGMTTASGWLRLPTTSRCASPRSAN